jgi:hypothetical protein
LFCVESVILLSTNLMQKLVVGSPTNTKSNINSPLMMCHVYLQLTFLSPTIAVIHAISYGLSFIFHSLPYSTLFISRYIYTAVEVHSLLTGFFVHGSFQMVECLSQCSLIGDLVSIFTSGSPGGLPINSNSTVSKVPRRFTV